MRLMCGPNAVRNGQRAAVASGAVADGHDIVFICWDTDFGNGDGDETLVPINVGKGNSADLTGRSFTCVRHLENAATDRDGRWHRVDLVNCLITDCIRYTFIKGASGNVEAPHGITFTGLREQLGTAQSLRGLFHRQVEIAVHLIVQIEGNGDTGNERHHRDRQKTLDKGKAAA